MYLLFLCGKSEPFIPRAAEAPGLRQRGIALDLDAAVRGFVAMAETKIEGGHLNDIYLKASANNTNNYELPEYYLPDEGKGAGPFIMACSEMMYIC